MNTLQGIVAAMLTLLALPRADSPQDLPISPAGQVLVVAANLQEAFDDADVADSSDMQQFVKRVLEQVPHVPDVLLVNEVRRESTQNVAKFLSDATGHSFVMAVDPGERPHRDNDQVRETSIILNSTTMTAVDDGGFIHSHFPEEARGPERKFRVRHKDHAHLLVQEKDSGTHIALLSVHLAHASGIQNRWVQELATGLQQKYPEAQMRIIGGDFNMSRVQGLGNWKKETLDAPPKEFWTILTEQFGYQDAIFTAAPDEITRAQELDVARIDYIFVQGRVHRAGSDLLYQGNSDPGDASFYSDHRFFWAVTEAR